MKDEEKRDEREIVGTCRCGNSVRVGDRRLELERPFGDLKFCSIRCQFGFLQEQMSIRFDETAAILTMMEDLDLTDYD